MLIRGLMLANMYILFLVQCYVLQGARASEDFEDVLLYYRDTKVYFIQYPVKGYN